MDQTVIALKAEYHDCGGSRLVELKRMKISTEAKSEDCVQKAREVEGATHFQIVHPIDGLWYSGTI